MIFVYYTYLVPASFWIEKSFILHSSSVLLYLLEWMLPDHESLNKVNEIFKIYSLDFLKTDCLQPLRFGIVH